MIRLLRAAAAAAPPFIALALCGCVTVLPKSKPVQLYRFGPAFLTAAPMAPSLQPSGSARGVILADVALPRSAAGDGILTVSGDEVAYVGGARWVEPAAVLLQADVQAAFAARANRVLLLDRGQTSAASGALRLEVMRFETRYDGAGAPTVAIRLRATLERPDGRAVLAQDFDDEQLATADRVSAIVAAYDQVVSQVLDRLVNWTDASVSALPAESAP